MGLMLRSTSEVFQDRKQGSADPHVFGSFVVEHSFGVDDEEREDLLNKVFSKNSC